MIASRLPDCPSPQQILGPQLANRSLQELFPQSCQRVKCADWVADFKNEGAVFAPLMFISSLLTNAMSKYV
jgi:hypothetical protein